MTAQERVTTVLNGGIPDRVPYQDAFWATTIERWHTEGLPQYISPDDYFGCEIAHIGGDYSLQLPIETIENKSQLMPINKQTQQTGRRRGFTGSRPTGNHTERIKQGMGRRNGLPVRLCVSIIIEFK